MTYDAAQAALELTRFEISAEARARYQSLAEARFEQVGARGDLERCRQLRSGN
jgi:hypothetical protein